MNITRLLGIVILAVGIVLLGFGISSSQAVSEKVMNDVVGHYTDHTMWYIIGGIAMIVGGAALAFSRCCKD